MPVANARSPQVLLEAFASKAIVAILIEVVDQRTSRRDAGHRATGHDGVLLCLVDCLPKGVGEWGEWHLREVSAAEPASQRQPYACRHCRVFNILFVHQSSPDRRSMSLANSGSRVANTSSLLTNAESSARNSLSFPCVLFCRSR